ncbi:alpha/beta fold hydrolase [Hydrogenophaga flava]|uniref:alpha/beta fold hydrolase n=1 Tax=Hydrogenophaga flava TaxID=65657 RepID=UPI000AC574D9|nr:alpha/beta hydrolase [Hydrogenophaga flava]
MTTLVLLPGMDGTGALFAPLLQALSPEIQPVVITYPSNERLGYAELVELVEKQLPTATDYVLLGESFSGPIATLLAGRNPPGLRALILACSFVRTPRPVLAPFRPLTRLLPNPALALGPLSFALMGKHATPPLRRALAEAISSVDPGVMRHRAAAALSADASNSLATVRCPVLYLQANEDRVIPIRCAAEVQRLCPQTHIASLPGPHFLLQTQAAAAAERIEAFIAGALNADRQ